MDTEERLPAPNGVSPFKRIRRTNVVEAEYWSRRDLAQVLGCPDYRNFEQAMKRAKTACFNTGQRVEDHFSENTEMVTESTMKLESTRVKQSEARESEASEVDMMDVSRRENKV